MHIEKTFAPFLILEKLVKKKIQYNCRNTIKLRNLFPLQERERGRDLKNLIL